MVNVNVLDLDDKAQVRRFIDLPFRLYDRHPQWVPPVIDDIKLMLNRKKHPFYEHSEAEFYLATQDGRDVGRLAVMENRRYNDYHHKKQAQFYLFECEDKAEAAQALFARAFEWARARGLNQCIGPKGFGAFDGYGILVEGFDQRQMMTMMNYNFDYYPRLLEQLGFEKEVDFASFYLRADQFQMPSLVHKVAERAVKRGTFQVLRFRNKQEMVKKWAQPLGEAYNRTFVNNWEYYPLTDREVDLLVENLTVVLDPRLVKLITRADQIVGFTLAFPDVSAALQRARGRLTPWALVDLLLDMRRTKWVSLNGNGILPEYQGLGGNALLYAEMEKTVRGSAFEHAELTQIAETAVDMRQDIVRIGGKLYKNHRVYRRQL
jgi:hypothetical protein